MKETEPFHLTNSQIQQIAACDFDHRPPGTILRDFEALLSLIGDQGLPVTSTQRLAMSCLATLNRRLTQPLELALKRPLQKSYPHINGLYLVFRATGLGLIDTPGFTHEI